MTWSSGLWRFATAGLMGGFILTDPLAVVAHPMGNFSISHYAGITVQAASIELRYLIDMVEIPTFQEIQATGISPECGHPSLDRYLAGKADALGAGLRLELNGRRLKLRSESREVLFTPGAGDLRSHLSREAGGSDPLRIQPPVLPGRELSGSRGLE